MTCNKRLEAYLREQQVPYEVQHHRITYTTHDTAVTEHIPDALMAKVVIVVAAERLAMLVLPATATVDVARASAVLGVEELRLAHEWEFRDVFPDCELGAMPPFGNLYDLPVYVDQALAANEMVVFTAGTHTDTIRMRYADFARLVTPAVAAFGRPRIVRLKFERESAARARRRSDMFI
jgi:Ala-tRNA(Pro) deacylase